ncbi:MAG: protein phosphatase CheZ [Syntrophobacteraceae bacterium]
MMQEIQEADLGKLIQFLADVEKNVTLLDAGEDRPVKIQSSREALKSFCETSAVLGLGELELAGHGLASCLDRDIVPNTNPESIYVFGFAISTLIEELKNASANGDFSQVIAGDVINALEGTSSEEDEAETAQKNAKTIPAAQSLSDEDAVKEIIGSGPELQVPDFSRLERIVGAMGGRLIFDPADLGKRSFRLQFAADPTVVEKIEALLSPFDPAPKESLDTEFSRGDERIEKILDTIKDFMRAFSNGDVRTSENILLSLAEQQHQAGIYHEIGQLARELHNSVKSFAQTLDPAIKEMVEHKIPDSGNRLEHILELTEKSANTTLDHVEEMQRRNQEDHERILQLTEMLQGFHAVGENSHKRLSRCLQEVRSLSNSLVLTRDDLNIVLTAQDYQDLTGQIIQKIIALLEDIELKLVNVIRTFGVKVDGGKKAEGGGLYGPAHKRKTEALHSQDDVDSLLAGFGF